MTKIIRVAYLIDTISSDKAGTEKQLLNIIQHLDKGQFEVTLLCLYESSWMKMNSLPCETICLGYRGFLKFNFIHVTMNYLRVLKNKEINLVQTFFEDSMLLGALGKVLCRKPHALIVSRRDLGLGSDEPKYHKIYKKIRPYIFSISNSIAVNAYAIKDHLSRNEKVRPDKITLIKNGMQPMGPLCSSPLLFKTYRADIWIGITANLKPVKRIDVFLRSLAHLNKGLNGIRVQAVILGEGRLKSELIQQAFELDLAEQVHFMGGVDNVNEYLQCIDIGVLCSDKEGLPNAVLEYMAYGLPVVATSVGGICELVDDTNGICVAPGDYKALGDALLKLVTTEPLRKVMGKKSVEKFRNGYTWDVIMPQWEEYYRSLV